MLIYNMTKLSYSIITYQMHHKEHNLFVQDVDLTYTLHTSLDMYLTLVL